MVRKSQRLARQLNSSAEDLDLNVPQTSPGSTVRNGQDIGEDFSKFSAYELVKMSLEKSKDPTVKKMLLALSVKLSTEISEYVEGEKRSRSVVVSGIPEADPDLRPSDRQLDLESKITELLDITGVECRPCEVYRLGRPDPSRPRLVKVVLPTRAHWRAALANAKLLRSSNFPNVFIRKSMTVEERRKDYEVRQIVKERNAGKQRIEWVDYKGEAKRLADLPKLPKSGNF